jgi:hypothetical protein
MKSYMLDSNNLEDRLKAKWESLREEDKQAYFLLYRARHWSHFIWTPRVLRGPLSDPGISASLSFSVRSGGFSYLRSAEIAGEGCLSPSSVKSVSNKIP